MCGGGPFRVPPCVSSSVSPSRKEKSSSSSSEISWLESRFKNWTDLDFLKWIAIIHDGKFASHIENIKTNFMSENFNVSQLRDITRNDLKDWGILDFQQRVELDKCFKNLWSKNDES